MNGGLGSEMIRLPHIFAGATQAAVPLRKKIAKVAVNVAAVAALTAAPAAMAYDVELGTEVFEGNCATCHTGGKNVLIPFKTLQKDAIEQYLEGGFNLTAITNQVHPLPTCTCIFMSTCRYTCEAVLGHRARSDGKFHCFVYLIIISTTPKIMLTIQHCCEAIRSCD